MHIDLFDKWFDETYPEGSLGLPILREAFKEVAKKAWIASFENVRVQDI